MDATSVADARRSQEHRLSLVPRLANAALRHPVATVAAVAVVVRLLAIAVLSLAYGGALFEDDSTYPLLAAQRAADDVGRWSEYEYFLYDATATFLVPLTALYRLLGPSVVVGQLLAAGFAVVAAAATAATVRVALPAGYALGAGLVVALLPSQVLFSSLVLKDAAVWAVLGAVAFVLARTSRSRGSSLLLWLAGLATLLWLLGHLRLHTLVAASCAAAVCAWLAPGPHRFVRGSGVLAVCIVVPLVAGIGPLGMSLVRDASGTLEARRQANAVGATTAFVGPSRPPVASSSAAPRPSSTPEVAAPVDPEPASGVSRDLRALPRGLSVLLVEPLPHQVQGNSRLRLALAENLLWWPLLLLAVLGLPAARRHTGVAGFPLLCGGAVLLLYALAEGNFGTAYRHRGELVWAVGILAAFGAKSLLDRRSSRAAGRVGLSTATDVGPPVAALSASASATRLPYSGSQAINSRRS